MSLIEDKQDILDAARKSFKLINISMIVNAKEEVIARRLLRKERHPGKRMKLKK